MTAQFKLQSVLDYRQWREDVALRELAAAAAREAELLQRLTREQEALEVLHRDFETLQREGMPPHEIALYREHIRYKVAAVESAARNWDAARREVEARRLEFCDKSRDKKLLEKVKEKELARLADDERRREMASLDAIAIQHFQR